MARRGNGNAVTVTRGPKLYAPLQEAPKYYTIRMILEKYGGLSGEKLYALYLKITHDPELTNAFHAACEGNMLGSFIDLQA